MQKKIRFTRKPDMTKQDIDSWVNEGKTNTIGNQMIKKRTTIYLPQEIHKKLKIEATNRNSNMSEMVVEIIQKHLNI